MVLDNEDVSTNYRIVSDKDGVALKPVKVKKEPIHVNAMSSAHLDSVYSNMLHNTVNMNRFALINRLN